MKEEQANIYTLYSDNKPFYIGKTEVLTEDGKVKMQNLGVFYANKELYKKVKSAKNFKVRILARTSNEAKVWFNEKLNKHKSYLAKKYDLLNSDKIFGLNGYAYWTGKERDKHTVQRLNESKYKPVVQYTLDGQFVKRWPAAKLAAKHYRVYELKGGSGESVIHRTLLSVNRKWKKWLWYRVSELEAVYGTVPQQLEKIDINPPSSRIKKVVLKCDDKGRVVDYYIDLTDAAENNNTTWYFLKKNLNTGNKFNGYYWKTNELQRDQRPPYKI